ncbi:hypothetical protein Pan97_41860 [Bremerella volcania]|uniref:DUF4142 domain-containing protein n=1 Tax=Bremerella volcania TaxID=2527984 RepID=A0A518CD54_9BACT|nr:DUF4142 domain-containing protein [Bremerella volcania]QDU77124.1 hypothetical protein Pan97_41860 [Bremerella volcania]
MSTCVKLTGCVILWGALCTASILAQAPAIAQKKEVSDVDALGSHVAIKLLLMNKEAIVLGELAEKKAQSDAVKKFAQEMVAKHGKLEKQLEPLIDSEHLESIESIDTDIRYPRGEPGTQQERADAESIRDNKWVLEGGPKPTAPKDDTSPKKLTKKEDREIEKDVDVVQYQLAAVKDHIQSVVERLDPLEGAEFDKAYLDQTIRAHAWMFAELGAMKVSDQPKLEKLSQQEKKMAEQHLAEARRIRDQLLRGGK